ncbi:MAG: right-handed parallel beta-helix repeat-containing protein [Bacteroidota bacterium]|nr:right-handed parallel beta-helix repeat-containing protein [Bacteroidota bacterium]
MNRTVPYILVLLMVSSGCREQLGPDQALPTPAHTPLSGHISGTLKFANSPFYLSGTIVIDSSQSVTIEPGVQVFCDDSTVIIVRGALLAQGTADKTILFTALHTQWDGIKILNSTGISAFQFAVFEKINAVNDRTRNGSIDVVNSSITVHNCLLAQNNAPSGGGISLSASKGTITNSVFSVNKASVYGGAVVADSSTATIVNNTFFGNTSWNAGGGLAVSSAQDDTIENNIFYENASRTLDPNLQILASDSSRYLVKYNFFGSDTNDPLFASTSDFHLLSSSPCRRAGNPSPAFNNLDGSRNDQGAYGGPMGNW